MIHDDWYDDGEEAGEHLWRLDVWFRRQWYQVQVSRFGSDVAKLFIERDGRCPKDTEVRIDYAFKAWSAFDAEAALCLTLSKREFIRKYRDLIVEVEQLPCDHKYCGGVEDTMERVLDGYTLVYHQPSESTQ